MENYLPLRGAVVYLIISEEHSPLIKFSGKGMVRTMKIRPLGDRVVLQKKKADETTKSGILLPDSAKEKPQEAVVMAVGPGKYEDGKNVPVQIKEGDVVIYSKYAGTEIKVGEEEYTIVSESDIIAKVE